jgi:hypothetical protein
MYAHTHMNGPCNPYIHRRVRQETIVQDHPSGKVQGISKMTEVSGVVPVCCMGGYLKHSASQTTICLHCK